MAAALVIFGVDFAAFCACLGARIVTRRERWAKRTLAVAVCLPVLCVLSIGPNAWLNTRHLMPDWLGTATKHLYDPIECLMASGPKPIDQAIRWYAGLWYPSAARPNTPARIK